MGSEMCIRDSLCTNDLARETTKKKKKKKERKKKVKKERRPVVY